jgi:hypothetical protein
MESRFVLLLLAQVAVIAGLTGCGRKLEKTEDASQPPVIEPDVARRDVKVANIDSENFEVGFSAGELSIEDFGVNSMVGAIRPSHHRGFFVEASVGRADTQLTSFERLSGAARCSQIRSASTPTMTCRWVTTFSGESFVGKDRSLNTATYLIGGSGRRPSPATIGLR